MATEPVVVPAPDTPAVEPAPQATPPAPAAAPNDTSSQPPAPVVDQAGPSDGTPAATPPPEPEPQFVTDEQLTAFGVTDVAAWKKTGAYKGMQGAFTKATQGIAARKQLLDTFESNPHETVRYLAAKLNIPLAEAAQAVAAQAAPATPAAPALEQTSALQTSLAEDFGADAAAKIVQVAQAMAEAQTAPLRESAQATQVAAVNADVASVMDRFDTAHVDWRTHEPEMVALGQTMPMRQGGDRFAYMENLYNLVTRDRVTAATVEAAQAREAAVAANQTPAPGQSGPVVDAGAKVAPKAKNINEAVANAFAAALKGQTFARR